MTLSAIVRQDGIYTDFETLLIHVLADAHMDFDKNNALEYLVQQGYLSRRSYAKIEDVLRVANMKKQKR